MYQEGNTPALPELVAAYADATATDNSLAKRQIEAVFAHRFYNLDAFADPARAGVDDHLGAYYRLVREVTEALGEFAPAHDAAMNWMIWASDNNNVAEYWLARARLATDEARRFTEFIADGPAAPAAETEIPLIMRMSAEISSYRPLVLADEAEAPADDAEVFAGASRQHAHEASESGKHRKGFSPQQWRKRAALTDALLRIAEALLAVNREDLARELHDMIEQLPNADEYESIALAKTLAEASRLHHGGKVVDAARLCASQLRAIGNKSVIAGIRLRQRLARYSVETGNNNTAFRMLSNNVAVADHHRLDIDHVLAVREMADVSIDGFQDKPSAQTMLSLSERAMEVSEGFPECAPTMENALLRATALYELGDFPNAGSEAEAVAKWSENTGNAARTDFACTIAAASAVQEGNTAHAALLYDALADIRAGYSAPISPAETLMGAALELSDANAERELSEHLMKRSYEYVNGTWETAKWHESQALLHWSVWDNQGVYKYADEAAELFEQTHAPADAARALVIGVRAACSENNEDRARALALRISDLVGPHDPVRDEVAGLMLELQKQRTGVEGAGV